MSICRFGAGIAGVLLLSASAALAADLPSRAPPPVFVPPPPVFTWTGFYIGGYGGYSFEGDVKVTSRVGTANAKRKGFTGGGLVGANYQFSSIVLGIEGEGGYDGEDAKASARIRIAPTVAPVTVNARERSDGVVARVRGRVGFSAGNFGFGSALIYAAGGGSYLKDKYTFTIPGAGSASVGKDRFGFNIGGGVEVAFTQNWIARVEYIRDEYGSENFPALVPGIPFKAKLSDNTVRGALIYKF